MVRITIVKRPLNAGRFKPMETIGEKFGLVCLQYYNVFFGGRRGIRTPETGVARLTVFETAAFNHSAILPLFRLLFLYDLI